MEAVLTPELFSAQENPDRLGRRALTPPGDQGSAGPTKNS
jgi:hypothetical protein